MYKTPSEHQISIFDFNRSCGTPLDESLEKAYKNVEKPNDGTTKQGKEHHE